MIEILVASRKMLENKELVVNTPHILISISGAPFDIDPLHLGSSNVKYDSDLCVDSLYLKFDDADDRDSEANLGKILFSENQARQVIDFVQKYTDKVWTIICQCEGGISRSSGTAAALAKILNGDDTFFFKCPRYRPNMWVYSRILRAFYYKDLNEELNMET